jgi:RNA polymerase sigma-70 factor (ECF subfamily)
MTSEPSRLSRIETPWSIVRKAHDGSDEGARQARQVLMQRYGGAARRYLGAVLRNDQAADELFQEFALRLMRGDFRSADPERGRFRSFVKSSLYHLIVDYRRQAARRERPLTDAPTEMVEPACDQEDELFIEHWRQELLDRSWASLAAAQQPDGAPYYSALRLLVENPDQSSEELAVQLSAQLDRTVNPGNLRVVIHRARQLFAEHLVSEVADSLEDPVADQIEQELIDLHLLEYCRTALARRRDEESSDVPQAERTTTP